MWCPPPVYAVCACLGGRCDKGADWITVQTHSNSLLVQRLCRRTNFIDVTSNIRDIVCGSAPLLVHLTCNSVSLESLTGLSAFTNLERLYCERNPKLRNLDGLSALINLNVLSIYGNDLTSLDDLSGLTKLRELSCGRNTFTELCKLPPSLHTLKCDDNSIGSLGDMSKFTKLSSLSCSRNGITSLDGISTLTNLEKLEFSYNLVERADWLSRFVNLRILTCSGTDLCEIPPLHACSLQYVDTTANKLLPTELQAYLCNSNEDCWTFCLLTQKIHQKKVMAVLGVAKRRPWIRDVLKIIARIVWHPARPLEPSEREPKKQRLE